MGKTYDVKFTVTLPDGVEATEQEVEAWVAFAVNAKTSLNPSPVSDFDMQANPNSVFVQESW